MRSSAGTDSSSLVCFWGVGGWNDVVFGRGRAFWTLLLPFHEAWSVATFLDCQLSRLLDVDCDSRPAILGLPVLASTKASFPVMPLASSTRAASIPKGQKRPSAPARGCFFSGTLAKVVRLSDKNRPPLLRPPSRHTGAETAAHSWRTSIRELP